MKNQIRQFVIYKYYFYKKNLKIKNNFLTKQQSNCIRKITTNIYFFRLFYDKVKVMLYGIIKLFKRMSLKKVKHHITTKIKLIKMLQKICILKKLMIKQKI